MKVKKTKSYLVLVICLFTSLHTCLAQFAGPVGAPNSTAIFKDSTIFKHWATGCVVQRGYLDIANKSLGLAVIGNEQQAINKAGVNGIVSLGDSGVATLSFDYAITNGPGADFAVFENGFSDKYLELAFVEVSNDGIKFVRFAATSNTQRDSQIGGFDELIEAEKINNLAGKYRVNYGTPFDLEELKDSLDVNDIKFVRIVDVIGSIDPAIGSKDSKGQMINEAYPTAFPSGGFDLDAVGVIHHANEPLTITALPENQWKVYPNPSNAYITILGKDDLDFFQLMDLSGNLIMQGNKKEINIAHLPNNIYFLTIFSKESKPVHLKIIKI